jgi:hypothetical protein
MESEFKHRHENLDVGSMVCPRNNVCLDYRVNNVCCDQCPEFCTQSGVKIINKAKEFEVKADGNGMPWSVEKSSCNCNNGGNPVTCDGT